MSWNKRMRTDKYIIRDELEEKLEIEIGRDELEERTDRDQ